MSFYIQVSYCRHQNGCIDIPNTNICPVVIILWQNILGHQQVALNSILTTLPNRNFHRADREALYYTAVELEKMRRKENRQRTEIQLQRPLLSPVDRRGERANVTE